MQQVIQYMCEVPTHDVDLVNTVGLLYRRVSHPRIQPTLDRKYLGEKIPESSEKQLEFAVHGAPH